MANSLNKVTTKSILDATIATADIADDAVTSAKIADDAITSALIADDAIVAAGIADNAVVTAAINADAVTGAKIADDAVGAEHIEQLDADLSFADNVNASFGASADLKIDHDGTNSIIENSTGVLVLQGNGSGSSIKINPKSGENSVVCVADGATNLYHNNTLKFETTSGGVQVNDVTLEISSTACHIDLMEAGVTDSNHQLRQNAGNLYFRKISDDKGTATTRMVLDGGTGGLTISDGDLVIETADHGINFHPHSGTANLLNDYEEGTWTASSEHGTLSSSNTRYTKIGRQVTCWGNCWNFSDNSTAANVQIRGIPFDPISVGMMGTAMWKYVGEENQGSYLHSQPGVEFYGAHSSNWEPLKYDDLTGNSEVYFFVTFETNS